MPISTNNSIRTLEVVEDPRVDLTLPQLEALVDKHFAAFQNFGRRTVEEAWQAGHYLNQAKALVGHGGWLPWLEERGIVHDTANRIMSLAWMDISQVAKFESVHAALECGKKHRDVGEANASPTQKNPNETKAPDPLSEANASPTLTIRNPEPLMRVGKELLEQERISELMSCDVTLAWWIHPEGGNGIDLWLVAWTALRVYLAAFVELSSESNEEDCQAVDDLHQAALIMATRFYSEVSRAVGQGQVPESPSRRARGA